MDVRPDQNSYPEQFEPSPIPYRTMAQSLTLNEIRARALAFSKEWKGEKSEAAEKQSFWNEFFNIFGIHRRRVASFEVNVDMLNGVRGKIDLFWPGLLLVEHKSAGKDLVTAFRQATDYFDGLDDDNLPKYVIVSDFARIKLYNLDDNTEVEFPLAKLHQNISAFGFLTGHTFKTFEEAPEVNVEAAQHMADLHDALKTNGYTDHPLAVLMVRLMFCMFADHTGIFPRQLFRDIIESKTDKSGVDVGPMIQQVFSVLDTPPEARQKNLDEDLASFRHVNGLLFKDRFDPPAFDAAVRKTLLKCLAFNWSAVSPAIFGSMFQMVMEEEKGKRRKIGAHYTSEKNILKCLRTALIDPLRAEFAKATTEGALKKLLARIAGMALLDPACGCGNFLVIAYRELRQIEIDIYRNLQQTRKRTDERLLSVEFMQGLNVDRMYGIEVEEFPCRVAETCALLDRPRNEHEGIRGVRRGLHPPAAQGSPAHHCWQRPTDRLGQGGAARQARGHRRQPAVHRQGHAERRRRSRTWTSFSGIGTSTPSWIMSPRGTRRRRTSSRVRACLWRSSRPIRSRRASRCLSSGRDWWSVASASDLPIARSVGPTTLQAARQCIALSSAGA